MQNFTSFSGEENRKTKIKTNTSFQLQKERGKKGAEGTTAPTNQVGPRRRGTVLLRKTRGSLFRQCRVQTLE